MNYGVHLYTSALNVGEHLACNDNEHEYGNWYCPDCDGNCGEEIGIKEPISKTFPRVNEFENDNSYRR